MTWKWFANFFFILFSYNFNFELFHRFFSPERISFPKKFLFICWCKNKSEQEKNQFALKSLFFVLVLKNETLCLHTEFRIDTLCWSFPFFFLVSHFYSTYTLTYTELSVILDFKNFDDIENCRQYSLCFCWLLNNDVYE